MTTHSVVDKVYEVAGYIGFWFSWIGIVGATAYFGWHLYLHLF